MTSENYIGYSSIVNPNVVDVNAVDEGYCRGDTRQGKRDLLIWIELDDSTTNEQCGIRKNNLKMEGALILWRVN